MAVHIFSADSCTDSPARKHTLTVLNSLTVCHMLEVQQGTLGNGQPGFNDRLVVISDGTVIHLGATSKGQPCPPQGRLRSSTSGLTGTSINLSRKPGYFRVTHGMDSLKVISNNKMPLLTCNMMVRSCQVVKDGLPVGASTNNL